MIETCGLLRIDRISYFTFFSCCTAFAADGQWWSQCVTTRMTSTSSSRPATIFWARDMNDRDFLSAPAWAAAAVKGPSQGSRLSSLFIFLFLLSMPRKLNRPDHLILYTYVYKRGEISLPYFLALRCYSNIFSTDFFFFFFFVCPRPVAVAPGHVRINLFYITDREMQRGKYIRIEKRKKGRQYIHDQVVRHVWISGTCTRILSSFSALPVLCCSDYSFAVCRRHARINSTPLFHLAHFSLLIDIRQGSEREKIGDLVHVWSKEVFPSSSLFPLSLLLVFAHIFASPLALPNVLTLGWPTTGNKKN